MPDPLQEIQAAAQTPVAGAAPMGGAGAPNPQSVVVTAVHRLIEPWPKAPPEYQDGILAGIVNNLDGAAEAQLGESVELCVDAMLGGKVGGSQGSWPIVHLGKSLFTFVRVRRNNERSDRVVKPGTRPKR